METRKTSSDVMHRCGRRSCAGTVRVLPTPFPPALSPHKVLSSPLPRIPPRPSRPLLSPPVPPIRPATLHPASFTPTTHRPVLPCIPAQAAFRYPRHASSSTTRTLNPASVAPITNYPVLYPASRCAQAGPPLPPQPTPCPRFYHPHLEPRVLGPHEALLHRLHRVTPGEGGKDRAAGRASNG